MTRKIVLSLLGAFSLFSIFYFFYYFGRDVMDNSAASGVAGFLSQDRNDEAISLINETLPGHGADGSLFYFKAVALKNKGLYKEALSELEKSIALGYPEILSYNLKGFILGEYFQDPEGQIFWASKSISMDPFDPEAYFVRALGYAASGLDEKALSDLNSAVSLAPSDFSLLPERAAVLIRLKKYPEAVRDLKKASEKYPENPEIWFGLYNAYLAAGLRSNAFYCVSRAVLAAPQEPVYLEERAVFWEEAGNYYEAFMDMGKALRLYGKNIPSYAAYFISKQLYRLNRQKEALEYANLAMGGSGADLPLLYDLRGRINFQQGRFREAVGDWGKSAGMGNRDAGERLAFFKSLPGPKK